MLHPRIWKDPLGYNTAYGMGVNRTTEMPALRTVIAPLAYADRRISKPRSKMELVELERSARRETVHLQIWFHRYASAKREDDDIAIALLSR